MANTDERLKRLAEQEKGCYATHVGNSIFAAQEALKARDALRRIRDVCNPETSFTRAVSKPVLNAMVKLIDEILEGLING